MKVLITCGPTWVAIDDVRVISNTSTGEMGHVLAAEFIKAGAKVTLVEGQVTHAADIQGVSVIKYAFFDELDKILRLESVKKYDIIVHAAAVSDFKPQAVKGKISSGKTLRLNLTPTKKIINTIKRHAPDTLLVGFKLVPGMTVENAAKHARPLFQEPQCDLVVANSAGSSYRSFIVDASGAVISTAKSKIQTARSLVNLCRKRI